MQKFHFCLVAVEADGIGRDVLGYSEVQNQSDEDNNIDSHSGITKGIDILTTTLRLPFMVAPKKLNSSIANVSAFL